MKRDLLPDIKQTAAQTGADVYLVGGSVRDILLGHTPADADFVVFGADYEHFARALAKRMQIPAIPFKDNMRLPYGAGYIDISAPRGADIAEDLLKRDFTINNLALDMEGTLHGSRADLDKGVIRPVHPKVFYDDPLRILRGYRQAASLGFTLSEEFLDLVRSKVPLIEQAASERVYHELRLLALAASAPEVYSSMAETGVWMQLTGITPPAERLAGADYDGDEDHQTAFFLAAVLADATEPAAVLKRLSASGAVTRLTLWLLDISLDLAGAERDEIRRIIWRAFLKERTEFLFRFAVLRYPGTDDALWRQTAGNIDPEAAELVSGSDLLKLAPDRRQGPWMAEALENTKLALAYGAVHGREEALAYLTEQIKNI